MAEYKHYLLPRVKAPVSLGKTCRLWQSLIPGSLAEEITVRHTSLDDRGLASGKPTKSPLSAFLKKNLASTEPNYWLRLETPDSADGEMGNPFLASLFVPASFGLDLDEDPVDWTWSVLSLDSPIVPGCGTIEEIVSADGEEPGLVEEGPPWAEEGPFYECSGEGLYAIRYFDAYRGPSAKLTLKIHPSRYLWAWNFGETNPAEDRLEISDSLRAVVVEHFGSFDEFRSWDV